MSRTKPVGKQLPIKVVVENGKEEIEENSRSYKEEYPFDIDPDGTYFPTLFCVTKTGKVMRWFIWAIGDLVYQTNGFVDGKLKEPVPRKINQLKNKNAVSSEEQALLYSERAWIKQFDKGYKPDENNVSAMEKYNRIMKEKALQGGNNTGLTISNTKSAPKKATALKNANKPKQLKVEKIVTLFTPMKAHKLSERLKTFITDKEVKADMMKNVVRLLTKKKSSEDPEEVFQKKNFDATEGFMVQPKLDGWRCVIRLQLKPDLPEPIDYQDVNNYETVMTTQDNKQYPWFKHIKDEYKIFVGKRLDLVIDGEVYAHKLIIDGEEVDKDDRFNAIQSASGVSRTEPSPYETQISLHVFDVIDFNAGQEERFETLSRIFKAYLKKQPNSVIFQKVPTYEAYTLQDVYNFHDQFFQEDYEGVMVRAKYAPYTETRSMHLLKYKEFQDKEFLAVGATTGEGTEEGCVMWICKTENGKTFPCRQRGTTKKKREIYQEYFKKYGNKLLKNTNKLGWLTVRYQNLTSEGVPRFPVGVGFRETSF